jgi:UDP-N-acetylglucosamine 4,6-dehydratase/5-epimerase
MKNQNKIPERLNNSTICITGGTGSFGHEVMSFFLDSDVKEIRVVSRDEKKQDDMRKRYSNEKLKFFIGDVRDKSSLKRPINGCDFLFHAAALKQVPSCEFFPMEAVKTNVIGTDNVLDCSIEYGVKSVVCLSTDKSVYPINAMGISKALMEKVIIARSKESSKTIICATRYGNVMGSRGSVIPLFTKQIQNGNPITITNSKMTRFMMSLNEAVHLVLYAFDNGKAGDIFVQKSPATTIDILAKAMLKIFNKPNHSIVNIGDRHGEKLYESLVSKEEMFSAVDMGQYYKITPDSRDLNYGSYISEGKDTLKSDEYNSHNTNRLDLDQTVELLKSQDFFNEV